MPTFGIKVMSNHKPVSTDVEVKVGGMWGDYHRGRSNNSGVFEFTVDTNTGRIKIDRVVVLGKNRAGSFDLRSGQIYEVKI